MATSNVSSLRKKKNTQILGYEDSLLLLRNQSTGSNATRKSKEKKPVSMSTKLKEKEGRLSLPQRLKLQRPEMEDGSDNVGGKDQRMTVPKETRGLDNVSGKDRRMTMPKETVGSDNVGGKDRRMTMPKETVGSDNVGEKESRPERLSLLKSEKEEEIGKVGKRLREDSDSEDELRKRRRLHEQQLRMRRQEEIKKQREYDELQRQKRQEEVKKQRESAEVQKKMQEEEEQAKMKQELHAKIMRKKLAEVERARSREALEATERKAKAEVIFSDNLEVMKDFLDLLNTPPS